MYSTKIRYTTCTCKCTASIINKITQLNTQKQLASYNTKNSTHVAITQ